VRYPVNSYSIKRLQKLAGILKESDRDARDASSKPSRYWDEEEKTQSEAHEQIKELEKLRDSYREELDGMLRRPERRTREFEHTFDDHKRRWREVSEFIDELKEEYEEEWRVKYRTDDTDFRVRWKPSGFNDS
jgi:hypothetical protein